jgi:hypothetical protein
LDSEWIHSLGKKISNLHEDLFSVLFGALNPAALASGKARPSASGRFLAAS